MEGVSVERRLPLLAKPIEGIGHASVDEQANGSEKMISVGEIHLTQ